MDRQQPNEGTVVLEIEQTQGEEQVLLKAREVARLLGLSRSLVYEMMASGRLPIIRIGRAVRVPKRALLHWIRTNTQDAEASRKED